MLTASFQICTFIYALFLIFPEKLLRRFIADHFIYLMFQIFSVISNLSRVSMKIQMASSLKDVFQLKKDLNCFQDNAYFFDILCQIEFYLKIYSREDTVDFKSINIDSSSSIFYNLYPKRILSSPFKYANHCPIWLAFVLLCIVEQVKVEWRRDQEQRLFPLRLQEMPFKLKMVLTQSQKTQLNKDILQYLVKNEYPKAAQKFSQEIGVSLQQVDPQGNKLEIKWKSILALQKKITTQDEIIKNLQEDLAKGPIKQGQNNVNLQDLYLPKAPAKFILEGHKANITSIAFHPQYTQIATSSQDGSIKIWQFQSGDFQRTLKGHIQPVNNVNYDPQGRYLVSCSSDLTIKLWDLNNDYVCFKTLSGHNHNVSYVNFTPEGDSVLSCSRDKTIKLWQVTTGYCKQTYNGHQGWVRRLSIAKDGKTFVSCSDDQSIIVWNLNNKDPVSRFFAHDNGQTSAKLMNSQFLKHKFTAEVRMAALKQLNQQGVTGVSNYYQTFILSAGRDKLIKLFLAQTGEHLHTFFGHDNWVRSLSLHSSGKYLYSSSDDKTIRIWDLNFGKQKKKIEAHEHFISSVKFNAKYGVVASGGNDKLLKIWHLK